MPRPPAVLGLWNGTHTKVKEDGGRRRVGKGRVRVKVVSRFE